MGCNAVQKTDLRAPASSRSALMAPSKWDTSKFPLKIRVSEDFASAEDQAIRDMANAWSDSVSNMAEFMDASYTTQEKNSLDLNSYEDAVIGVYKLTQWPSELPRTALAVTQIIGIRKNAGKSSEYIAIEHADILVNYEVFSFSTDLTWGYDLQTIILHEMGHLLGLYHDESSVDQSVMYPSITRYDTNRFPKERDIQNLESKYGISRTGSSVSQAFRQNLSNNTQDTNENAEEEIVVIQFELMADGTENRRIL